MAWTYTVHHPDREDPNQSEMQVYHGFHDIHYGAETELVAVVRNQGENDWWSLRDHVEAVKELKRFYLTEYELKVEVSVYQRIS